MTGTNFGLWSGRHDADYRFIDESMREWFNISGTIIRVWKYIGPVISKGDQGSTPATSVGEGLLAIQDALLLENRDRIYDPNIYECYGVYNVLDQEYALMSVGMVSTTDTIYLEFHQSSVVEAMGRRFVSGDVFEIPHLRDDLIPGSTRAINKFYVVQDVTRSASGYSPTWLPHVIRCKITPMPASQEFQSILDAAEEPDGYSPDSGNPGDPGYLDPIRDYQTNEKILEEINAAIVAVADELVPDRNFRTAHYYVIPGDEDGSQYPWIWAGDGIPPNGAALLGRGSMFPIDAQEGDWFLRTDWEPNVLFHKEGPIWKRKEVDYARKWEAAHRILEGYINNTTIVTMGSDTFTERQSVSKAVRSRLKPDKF